jgi:hypothetical protein
MDYCRAGYQIDMQFDEKGLIVVPVTWYACAPGAQVFPGFHLYVSGHTWNPHGLPTIGIGERWDSKPIYYNSALPFYAPGTGSFCGPDEWFRSGCPSDAPPIQYSDAGVPTCCPQPPCQPWYDASYAGGRNATGTPGYPWTDGGQGFTVSNWECHGGDDSVAWTPGGTGLCEAQPVTIGAVEIESTGPYSFDLQCTAYNDATFTGTWIPATGSIAPPGFIVFFKCPPT